MRASRRLAVPAAVAAAATALAGVVYGVAGSAAAATDRPNSLAGARGAAPVANATWVREKIGTATDQDWFRFDVPRAGQVMANLGGLPANYSLDIYDSAGHRVRGSNASGRQFERVLWSAPAAGTYFARVDSAGAFNASTTYALRFEVLRKGLAVLSQTSFRMGNGHASVSAEIRNTSSSWLRIQSVHLDLRDTSGATIYTDAAALTNIVLPPGGVSHITTASVREVPATFKSARVRPIWTTAAAGANPKLKVHPTSTGTGPRFTGTVSTTSATARYEASVYVNYYDAYGRLLLTGAFYAGDDGAIPAGGSGAYDVTMSLAPFYPRPNRVTLTPFVQRF
jgi:hypothetical protein